MHLTIERKEKAAGVCLWQDCEEQAQRLPGTELPRMWCPAHEAEVMRQWDEVLARSPGYARYWTGKDD